MYLLKVATINTTIDEDGKRGPQPNDNTELRTESLQRILGQMPYKANSAALESYLKMGHKLTITVGLTAPSQVTTYTLCMEK